MNTALRLRILILLMLRYTKTAIPAAMFLLLTGLSAEITSRVEDLVRTGVPFWGTPDFDADLFITNEHGERQGKPNGCYQKYRLNQFGCRGPQVSLEHPAETTRIVLLGSSETFGLYESPEHDYPAQLRAKLKPFGKYEVINASLPGMTLSSAHAAFNSRFRQFEPDIVVIYVSPLFELNRKPSWSIEHATTTPARKPSVNRPSSVGFRSRILLRVKNAIEKPEFWQRLIDRNTLSKSRAGLGPDGIFKKLPTELVARYLSDMAATVESVRAAGAVPILVTHAIQSHNPPNAQDLRTLEAFLQHTPRATPSILLEYETAVRQGVLEYAARNGLTCVDLAAELNGRREAFGDLVHFTDVGAEVAASAIAKPIAQTPLGSARSGT